MKPLKTALYGAMGSSLFASAAAAAPNPAEEWESLWRTVMLDITIIGVILLVAAVYMLVRFRASSPDQVGTAKPLTTAGAIAWALIPASIFMADDFYLAANGWQVWNTYRTVPEGATEINVTASMWQWEFEYPETDSEGEAIYSDTACYEEDGKRICGDGLVVPVGQPVVLRMTSDDVIHSFSMHQYRVKEDVMPGRTTYIWFNPTEVTDTFVTCVEFCGKDHSKMYGQVKVVSQADYAAWLAKEDKVHEAAAYIRSAGE